MAPGSHYDRYLSPGERVAFEVRRHAAALLGPAVRQWGRGSCSSSSTTGSISRSDSDPIDTIMFIVVMALTLRAVWKWFEWQIERVLVTNKRIVEVSGIITRQVASMPLGKVTDLTYQRAPLREAVQLWRANSGVGGPESGTRVDHLHPAPRQVLSGFHGDVEQRRGHSGIGRRQGHREIPRVRSGWRAQRSSIVTESM